MDSYEKRTWWSRYGLTERLGDDQFLEAAITGAFVIAAADGQASEVEHDALIDRLEILGGVDRDRIDEHLAAASRTLEEGSFEEAIGKVASLLQDKNAAEAAMMLSLTIALADDDVSDEERDVAGKLAAGIGLPGLDVNSMLVELQGVR